MDEEKIKQMIDYLKESPLYAMSLGGRELYHSNFWAWLMRKYPGFINVFFENIETDGVKITREEKNHDLTIHTKNNKIYIIENKIKSLPSKEQLDRYLLDMFKSYIDIYKSIKNSDELKGTENKEKREKQLKEPEVILKFLSEQIDKTCDNNIKYEKAELIKAPKYIKKLFYTKEKNENTPGNNEDTLILTGLSENGPVFLEGSGWKYLSYFTIVENIRTKLNIVDDDENKKIIKRYCDDTQKLADIVSELLEDSKDKFSFENASLLKDIRFDDIYKKLKMEHFANTIDLNKIGDSEIDGFVLKIDGFVLKKEVDYSNKQASLTIKYEKISGEERNQKKYAIGIQIQEYAFRFFVEAPKLAKKLFAEKPVEEIKKFFDSLVNAGWFVDKKETNTLHGKSLATTKEPCNKYEPDFIYQYYKLDKDMTYGDLRKVIYDVFNPKSFSEAFKTVSGYHPVKLRKGESA